MLVKDVMRQKVITVSRTENLEKALGLMQKNKINSLVVTESGKVVGIITHIDIAQAALSPKDLKKIKVREAMPRFLFSISPDESIFKAFEIMRIRKIGRLPVLKYGKLVGIVTVSDLNFFQNEIFYRAQRIASVRNMFRERVGF